MSAGDPLVCAACGAETPAGNVFCGICGARLQAAPADSLIGKVIAEKFRVVRLLGSGGMGAIYLAEHVGIGKRVAIKLLRADLRGHPHLVKRFRREAMAVSRLTDAHTITVFDFGVWDGVVYLVMEYLIGDDLSKTLAVERRLTPQRALTLVHQICSSLAEAHAEGVVHRDLKPENVFLTRSTSGDEYVKVLDFGLAKILAPEGAEALLQTADGALMGTPYYMAPEQVRGEAVDARTDLYALGGLLFRMLTGQVPYIGKSPLQVMEAHVGGALRRFVEVDPELDMPPGVEELVRWLMARDPADRPDSALAVDQRVGELLEAMGQGRSEGPRHRPVVGSSPVDTRPDPAPEDEDDPTARNDALPEHSSQPDPAPPVALDGQAPASVEPASQTSPGRPSALGDGPPATAGAPGDLSFDDGPDDRPQPLDVPAEPSRSWIIGDTTPPADGAPLDRRRRRSRAPWLLLAILIAAGAGAAGYRWYADTQAPPTAEVEPNDEPARASPIAEDIALTGTIGPSESATGDRDVFVIEVPPERPHLRARVSGVDGLDLVLEAVAYDGTPLFSNNNRGAGRGEWGQARVESDRALVVVRAHPAVGGAPATSAAPYRLSVRFSDRPGRRGWRGRQADGVDDGQGAEPEPEADVGADADPEPDAE